MNEYEVLGLSAAELERRRNLCDQPCTLDGEPSRITGARLRCGVVRALNKPDSEGYLYSWPCIARIMEQGGRFKT